MSNNSPDIILKCDCSEISHLVRFTYFDDGKDGGEFMYVQSGMDAGAGFFHRLRNAFKYLFKFKEGAWVFAEAVMLPSDMRDLTQFLQKYNEYITKNNLFR